MALTGIHVETLFGGNQLISCVGTALSLCPAAQYDSCRVPGIVPSVMSQE